MDIEKRLALLQNTYAASIAETVNTYDKLNLMMVCSARTNITITGIKINPVAVRFASMPSSENWLTEQSPHTKPCRGIIAAGTAGAAPRAAATIRTFHLRSARTV